MKICVVILAALCVGCYAPDISLLINAEVKAILASDPRMTLVDCATKCDAEFDLIAGRDEQLMDRACHDACDCAINHNNCHGHNTGHVTRPHVTHRPHGTRAPAPTNGDPAAGAPSSSENMDSGAPPSTTADICQTLCALQLGGDACRCSNPSLPGK